MLNGEVAEVEEDVAHTSIFPIQNADAGTIIDEIAVEQVVVAGTEGEWFVGIHGRFDLARFFKIPIHFIWQLDIETRGGLLIFLCDTERGERTREEFNGVIGFHRFNNMLNIFFCANLFGWNSFTGNEARDDVAFRGEKGDGFRSNSNLSGEAGG